MSPPGGAGTRGLRLCPLPAGLPPPTTPLPQSAVNTKRFPSAFPALHCAWGGRSEVGAGTSPRRGGLLRPGGARYLQSALVSNPPPPPGLTRLFLDRSIAQLVGAPETAELVGSASVLPRLRCRTRGRAALQPAREPGPEVPPPEHKPPSALPHTEGRTPGKARHTPQREPLRRWL